MKVLQNIQQGKGSVDELNIRFHFLIQKAGLDQTNNAVLLVQMYEDAISPALFRMLVTNQKNDAVLDTYMQNASATDQAYRRTTTTMKNTFQKHKGKCSPNYY